jgi:hypothetical protein
VEKYKTNDFLRDTMLQSFKTFVLSVAVGCLFAAPFIVETVKELNK